MKRLAFVLAFVLAASVVAAQEEPACGTLDAPKWCASLTSGAVTVVTRGEKREYATVGLVVDGPLAKGWSAYAYGDVFAQQDGAAADLGIQRTFRTIYVEGGIEKSVSDKFNFKAHGGVTYSIEGQQGAPLDPRQYEALIDAMLKVNGGWIAVRGGHDGAVGGWAVGADINIPVKGGSSLVAKYQFPLSAPKVSGADRAWVVTAGARIRVASFRLGK